MNIKDQVKKYIQDKVDVSVYRTDEAWHAGDYHWVVSTGDDNFWLSAFRKEKTAIRFCKKFGLKVV